MEESVDNGNHDNTQVVRSFRCNGNNEQQFLLNLSFLVGNFFSNNLDECRQIPYIIILKRAGDCCYSIIV